MKFLRISNQEQKSIIIMIMIIYLLLVLLKSYTCNKTRWTKYKKVIIKKWNGSELRDQTSLISITVIALWPSAKLCWASRQDYSTFEVQYKWITINKIDAQICGNLISLITDFLCLVGTIFREFGLQTLPLGRVQNSSQHFGHPCRRFFT